MKEKLIFLDIDGVVNTLMIYDKPFEGNLGHVNRDGFYFDLCSPSDERVSNLQAVMWLNKLCKETGAKIVISSTWRGHEDEGKLASKSLYNSGLYRDIQIEGVTPWLGHRGQEIISYLQTNYPEGVYSYVVIDDDSADMDGVREQLVKCDTDHGFGYREYVQAIKILGEE